MPSVTTVSGASWVSSVVALNSAGGAQMVCSPTETKIATTPKMMAPIPPRDFKTCHLFVRVFGLAHHCAATRLALHHSSKRNCTAPLGSARPRRSCRNVVHVADKPTSRRSLGDTFNDIRGRLAGVRDRLAGRRAQQQFTVPAPEDYPNTPIVEEAEEIASNSPVGLAADVVSRPLRPCILFYV